MHRPGRLCVWGGSIDWGRSIHLDAACMVGTPVCTWAARACLHGASAASQPSSNNKSKPPGPLDLRLMSLSIIWRDRLGRKRSQIPDCGFVESIASTDVWCVGVHDTGLDMPRRGSTCLDDGANRPLRRQLQYSRITPIDLHTIHMVYQHPVKPTDSVDRPSPNPSV